MPDGKDFELGGDLSEARPEKSSDDASGQMDVSNGAVADKPGMEYVVANGIISTLIWSLMYSHCMRHIIMYICCMQT